MIHNCMHSDVAKLIVMFMHIIRYLSDPQYGRRVHFHVVKVGFAWKRASCIYVCHLIML